MKRFSVRTIALASSGALVLFGLATPLAAAQDGGVADILADPLGDVTGATAGVLGTPAGEDVEQDTGSGWTLERMRAATPMDQLITETGRVLNLGEVTGEVDVGEPLTVPATPAGVQSLLPGIGSMLGGSSEVWTGGGEVVDTAGRVFFTVDGEDASCSGNSVTSQNGSTVLTAGHCVRLDDEWHEDWTFVPAFDGGTTLEEGTAPHGQWPAEELMATDEWLADEDINHDLGAAVVEPQDGATLADAVGGQSVAFNQERDQFIDAFGYPASLQFDGSELRHCSGQSSDDPLFTDAIGIGCDMTGGASGGPWFIDFDEQTGTGVQNSVTSFGYVFLPGTLFGPFFGDSEQALYEQAQTS